MFNISESVLFCRTCHHFGLICDSSKPDLPNAKAVQATFFCAFAICEGRAKGSEEQGRTHYIFKPPLKSTGDENWALKR